MKKLFFLIALLNIAIADEMVDNSGYDVKLTEKLSTALKNYDLEFRLVDLLGTGVSLSDYAGKKDLVIISLLPDCNDKKIVKSANKISKNIIFINPDPNTKRDVQAKTFPAKTILMDENQQVSSSYPS